MIMSFADVLDGFFGKTVSQIDYVEREMLRIVFSDGTEIRARVLPKGCPGYFEGLSVSTHQLDGAKP